MDVLTDKENIFSLEMCKKPESAIVPEQIDDNIYSDITAISSPCQFRSYGEKRLGEGNAIEIRPEVGDE
jgi:hypothetical protein